MTIVSRSRTVVFDLDDTLYAEADYVLSGKRSLAKFLEQIYGKSPETGVFDEVDFISGLCRELNLPSVTASSLIWHYRLHAPNISLRPGAKALIETLRARGDRVCIITDGRSVTQRLKIKALGLDVDGIYISEEVGAEKPDPAAFIEVERDWPAESYVYVADNAAKDFAAPQQLRWLSVGFHADERAIYAGRKLPSDATMPDAWASNFSEVSAILMTHT